MQEVAPAPPAQIIISEMLLPQCFLHCSLDSRGRAACCRLLGVLGAEGNSHSKQLKSLPVEVLFRNYGCSNREHDLSGSSLTVVAGQTPARGDAGHSSGKDIGGLSQADGRHVGAQASGGGQLDQGDVVVDGVGIPLGMGEHLEKSREGVEV